jgi:DNA-binding XRE family transcriptional regulator
MQNITGNKLTEFERALECSEWTNASLARELEVSERTMHNYRKGTTLPKIDKALRIAQLLKKPVKQLFPAVDQPDA